MLVCLLGPVLTLGTDSPPWPNWNHEASEPLRGDRPHGSAVCVVLPVSCERQLTCKDLQPSAAQTADASPYKDPATGIVFKTWSAGTGASSGSGPFTFGMALPSDALTKDATEYIGLLVCFGLQNDGFSNLSSAAKSPTMPFPATAVSPTASRVR